MRLIHTCAVGLLLVFAMQAKADVAVYNNRNVWLSTVGSHEFLGFTEYPEFTHITTQYAHQGIIFPDGDAFVTESSAGYRDGHGLVTAGGTIPGTMRM